MRKLPLVLAAAVAFDLGAVVVTSQAAEAKREFLKIKLDATHSATGCEGGGGMPVDGFCQLPKGVALQDFHFTASKAEATKAPAKKEEAKKE